MREGEEDNVVTRERFGGRLDERQMCEGAQVRLGRDEGLTGVAVSGDGPDLEIGVTGEQPQQLTARIAARASDGNGIGHDFNLRVRRDGIGAATSSLAEPEGVGSAARRRRDSARATRTAGGKPPERTLHVIHPPTLPLLGAGDASLTRASAARGTR